MVGLEYFDNLMHDPRIRESVNQQILLGQQQEENRRAQEAAQRAQEQHQASMEAQNMSNQKAKMELDLADLMQSQTGDINAWVGPDQMNGQPNPYRKAFHEAPPEVRQHFLDAYGNKESAAEIEQRYNNSVRGVTGDRSVGMPQGLSPATASIDPEGKTSFNFSATATQGRHPTETETKAGGFVTVMDRAEQDIAKLEQEGLEPWSGLHRWNERKFVPGELKSDAYKTYMAAREQWIQAATHTMSGAGTNPTEAQKKAEAFFPLPGSGKEVHEQQKKARKEFMDYWQGVANKAGLQTPGNPTESKSPRPGRAEMMEWLLLNPNHPKAPSVRQKLGLP